MPLAARRSTSGPVASCSPGIQLRRTAAKGRKSDLSRVSFSLNRYADAHMYVVIWPLPLVPLASRDGLPHIRGRMFPSYPKPHIGFAD
jgi:hypothetical protein